MLEKCNTHTRWALFDIMLDFWECWKRATLIVILIIAIVVTITILIDILGVLDFGIAQPLEKIWLPNSARLPPSLCALRMPCECLASVLRMPGAKSHQCLAQGKKFGCQTAPSCHLHFVVQADSCRTKHLKTFEKHLKNT